MIRTALLLSNIHISKVIHDETLKRNSAKVTGVHLDVSGDREHLHRHFVFAPS